MVRTISVRAALAIIKFCFVDALLANDLDSTAAAAAVGGGL